MTCTIIGLILHCLIPPAPQPPDLATLFGAQSYIAIQQSDGLHVYIMIPRNPPEPPAPVIVTPPPIYAYGGGYYSGSYHRERSRRGRRR
jgi:carboxylesterase type B